MSKTPPFLEHIPSLPEKLLQHEENIFCLGETVNTQQHMIDFLKEKYDSIKRRTFELMTANKEMRNIITAHVKIIAGLRANKNLTLVQEDLLLQFDQVHRAVCGKRRSHVDHVPTRRYSLIESLIVNPSVNRANMFESSSTQGSFVEVPASTTDVIVLKKRQSAIRKPNHPNMKALLTFPLFAQFPEDVMKEISASSYEIRKEEGQIVLKKGEEGREIFFLLEGTVSVLLDEEAEVTSTLQPITCFRRAWSLV
ncbi:hypothetical protein BDR26DRAFT_37502 [Obelidium mucronatum]|nr:hypothetical protein BDR26DRAFT_37502 [Obelidium mucronatum]